jgi:hypothetical protein
MIHWSEEGGIALSGKVQREYSGRKILGAYWLLKGSLQGLPRPLLPS